MVRFVGSRALSISRNASPDLDLELNRDHPVLGMLLAPSSQPNQTVTSLCRLSFLNDGSKQSKGLLRLSVGSYLLFRTI